MIGTLQQVFDDMEHGVYDFTENGKCIGCGKCCASILPLSSSEIKEIRHKETSHQGTETLFAACGSSF